MMHKLSIDLETFSSVPIAAAGANKYAASPDFSILLFAYAVDGGDVQVIDVAQGETVPDWLVSALHDPAWIKTAFNAAFEIACLSRYYGPMIPGQWRDTMLQALYAGFPASLEAAGSALGLPSDKQKLSTGKALIRYFCVPCRPTKANGGRTRNLPHHDPDKWQLFIDYNRQDVVTEMAIAKRLDAFPVPPLVQRQWETDLLINTRGVAVDMDMVHGALDVGDRVRQELVQEASQISGLGNPNSVSQLMQWLNTESETVDVSNLRKDTVADLLRMDGHSPEVRRMLEIRQELGKTSTKKYDAIQTCVCPDGRVRGLLQFYGANRTGRWAGRLVQVQNLPRTYITPLDSARELVTDARLEPLRLLFGSVPDTLSQLIRTVFVATPGNVLIDADFSAIEARVVAWLSGEQWVLDAFRAGKDIYCETASQMFGVPVVKGGENGHLRQRGKVAVLACGYGGGVAAMRRMDTGHLLDESSDDDVQQLVDDWRRANARTVSMWREMEDAAISVIQSGGRKVVCGGRVVFAREYDPASGLSMLTIKLPSGRKLYYVSPFLTTNRWGAPSIGYYGVQQTTRKWEPNETYGGKLVENVTQAVARDCLAEAIENLMAAGLQIVFHIHDEVVIDCPAFGTDAEMLHRVEELMTLPISWADGLPLSADGWVGKYFKKD